MRRRITRGRTAAAAFLAALCLALVAGLGDARALAPASGGGSDTVRVLSYNVRYDNPGDGPHRWSERREAVVERMRQSDVVAAQEVLANQLDDLLRLLPGFEAVGVGRDDGRSAGEFSPVLFRAERIACEESGTLWLSETPDVVGSRGWDAALPRIATWARLRDQTTGARFLFASTHFDHVGEEARTASARLLRERLPKLAGDLPLVLAGDFNFTREADGYRALVGDGATGARDADALRDTHALSATEHAGPAGTFSGFVVDGPVERCIDYVFVRGDVEVLSHAHDDASIAFAPPRAPGDTGESDGTREPGDAGARRYPSDHLPVRVELRFAAAR